jgi:hypothetical protein
MPNAADIEISSGCGPSSLGKMPWYSHTPATVRLHSRRIRASTVPELDVDRTGEGIAGLLRNRISKFGHYDRTPALSLHRHTEAP